MRKSAFYFIFFILIIGCDTDSNQNSSPTSNFNLDLSENVSIGNQELPPVENYTRYGENGFLKVSEQPISSFSLAAEGASNANTIRFLKLG